MPLQPPRCPWPKGGKGGKGSKGSMGGMMGNPSKLSSSTTASSSHSHNKRQQLQSPSGKGSGQSPSSSWLENLIPAVSVFLGGGGSAGSGSQFAAKYGNVTSGVYIGSSDKFQFTSEIVNYDPKEKEIYLTVDFEWVPGKVPGLLDVGMGALSVDDCFNPIGSFVPPKDKPITYKGAEWTVTQPGYFVDFTPHLHDGGVNIKIILNG